MKLFSSISVKFLLQVLLFNIILLISFWKIQEKDKTKDESKEIFTIPIITQENQLTSGTPLTISYINYILPRFFGKYKFSDSIHIKSRFDSALYRDFVQNWGEKDSTEIIPADGFQLMPDYKKNIYNTYYADSNSYYPVYLVNETKSIKLLHGKDQHLFALQEAKDSNGTWRPIEMRVPDFCGNGRWALKIHPNEFAAFAMPKYTGNYETDMRVRLKNGDNVLISNAFRGKINYNQFHLKEDSYFLKEAKEHPLNFKSYWFYDAFPLDFEEY